MCTGLLTMPCACHLVHPANRAGNLFMYYCFPNYENSPRRLLSPKPLLPHTHICIVPVNVKVSKNTSLFFSSEACLLISPSAVKASNYVLVK